VFATRSPHRPNPIGMSAVKLERIEGRVLHVCGLDILDGTPVLDIKPYVPYVDALPEAGSGWLQPAPPDPGPRYRVRFAERAQEQLGWLEQRSDVPLQSLIEKVLTDGPAPHAYRRVKKVEGGYRLGVKDFRVRFTVEGDEVCVGELATGYRKRVLEDAQAVATESTPLDVHRAFVARFGARAAK
jgi:mRNA-degrading endonuclease RelE of RelBE toxin-antitoxin system